jgi:sodium transport system permease protein
MSLRDARTVWAKELRETLRDGRTLFVMIVLPLLLYPVVGILGTEAVTANRAGREQRPALVAVEGQGRTADRLRAFLRRPGGPPAGRDAGKLELRPGGRAALARHAVGAVAVVAPDADQRLGRNQPAAITILVDEADDDSQVAAVRLEEAARDFAREEARAALRGRGVPESLVEPFAITTENVAPRARMGGYLLSLVLPMVTVLMVILGAFYPAIDVTAGEKERGTLETILCAPITRRALILGKFLCVATLAFFAGVLNLASMALTGLTILHSALGSTQVPWRVLPVVLVALVPAVLLFSAIMLAVAALARSFKEAQNALTPVYLVCVVPAMIASLLPGVRLGWLTALVPSVNVSLLVKDLIRGDAALGPALLAAGMTLVYAAAALQLAARIYDSERLLFATPGGRLFSWRRRPAGGAPPRRPRLEPAEALLLFGVVFILLILVGSRLQSWRLVPGLLVTEWVLILGTVILWLRANEVDLRSGLGLEAPRPRALLGALLAGASAWYLVVTLVEPLMDRVLPMPHEVVEQLRRLVGRRPLGVELPVMAISPAICEETLFRGALLRSLSPRLGRVSAIVLTGLLFGLFHMSVYRLVPAALLGVALGVVATRSGSLYTAMLFHAANNAAVVLLARFVNTERLPASAALVIVAALTFVAGLLLLGRGEGTKKWDPN